MRLRTQRTYLLLLFFTFILVDVSESIAFAPAIGILIRARQIPLVLRRVTTSKWVSSIWNKLKSLFNNVQKIGDIVSGISDVKDYLEIFGYLNLTSNSNFTDEFTVNLQSAIAEFQKNFNLTVTKQLDENMYQIISQPRCGVPDIINGTNTMNSNNNTTSFTPWWRTGENEKELTLTYGFYPQNNITDDVKLLFKDAFNKWTNVTALKFNETISFNGSNITIVFVRIDGKGGIVGGVDHMNYSTNVGRIYLDSEEEWVLSNEKIIEEGEVDLESVVMHEIGHVLVGLGHSYVEEAVMYPIVLPEKKTELVDDDDLQRIQQIYGLT